MADAAEYVTIFRTAESGAKEEADTVCQNLVAAGLDAIVVGDDEPGVVQGTYEVRVPSSQLGEAEVSLNELPDDEEEDEGEDGDASHKLDLVSIFESQNANAEVEALGIKAILDANNVPNLIIDATVLPNLPHSVMVPRENLEEAKRLIAEAQAAGPAAAEEASRNPQ